MAVALVVAGGRGERLGSERPKAFVIVAGRPMLEWCMAALRACRRSTRSSSPCRPARAPGRLRRRHRRRGPCRFGRAPRSLPARATRSGPRRRPPAAASEICSTACSPGSTASTRPLRRRRVTDTTKQVDARRHRATGRSIGRACGRSRRPRSSTDRCSSARSTSRRTSSPGRLTSRGSSNGPAAESGSSSPRTRTSRSRPHGICDFPATSSRSV